MLKFLDVLIGLASTMLLVSMVVMAVTHFIMAALKTRSRNLKSRLSELLGQIDPALAGEVGEKIAKAVLSKGQTKSAIGNANTINREQFTKALLDLAGSNSSFEAKDLLKRAMKDADIDDPDKTLEGIHSLAFELERQNPELALNVRYNLAILQEAESKFVSRIHAWFDGTMDRASERFKVQSRIWTYGVALGVALFLQLDTIQIVNRLTNDDVFRAAMVNEAQVIVKNPQVIAAGTATKPTEQTTLTPSSPTSNPAANSVTQKTAGTATTPGQAAPVGAGKAPACASTPTAMKETTGEGGQTATAVPTSPVETGPEPLISKQDKEGVAYAEATLKKFGLIVIPKSLEDWNKSWSEDWFNKLLGIFLSTVLLSLGAPFWYNALANLLRLRSVVAQKDDEQRAARAAQPSPQVAAAAASHAGAPGWMKGEQGNPQLVG